MDKLLLYSSYYNQTPQQNPASNNGLSIQFSTYPINPVVGTPTYFKINFNKLDVDYTVSITQQGNPIYSTLSHTAQGVANISFQFQTAGTYQVAVQANGMQQYPIQPVISTFSITVTSNQSTPSVSVTPNSASYVPGQALTLSAMVADTSNSPTIPTGPVTWSDGNIGGTFSSSTCYLSAGTCIVTYTPSSNAPNSITITADYDGDTSHTANSGTTILAINFASLTSSSSVTISSNPAIYVAGNAVTFTATVTGSTNSQNIPTGQVIWSDGNTGGTFSSSTCYLSSGTCIVTYTPSSNAPNSITITAS